MVGKIYLANTDVEFEYAHSSGLALERSWSRHPLCLQLQYLPLLYAAADDLVAVTEFPDNAYISSLEQTGWWPEGLPQMILLKQAASLKRLSCFSWGLSKQVQAWAEARGLHYSIPDWDIICLVNSKAFSFRYTTLPEAALLANERELVHWLGKTSGPKVIKTCFGLSGLGNRRADGLEPTPELLSLCRKEWGQNRPVVGEPWLERIFDFSTQWKILPGHQVEFRGATRFETDAYGTYQGTLAGPENLLFGAWHIYLQQHIAYIQKALEDIVNMGFLGSIGFDALVYRDPEKGAASLYPLVEINGRQTMSLVALLLQKKLCPDQVFRLAFQQNTKATPSLLPDRCHDDQGKLIVFRRRLTGEILSSTPMQSI